MAGQTTNLLLRLVDYLSEASYRSQDLDLTPRYVPSLHVKQSSRHRHLHYHPTPAQQLPLLTFCLACLQLSCFHIMWLVRKCFRIRVCQHALISCLILLTFVLMSYIFQEDEYKSAGKSEDINKEWSSENVVPVKSAYQNDAKCGQEYPCRQGEYAYHVKSGVMNHEKPYICVHGTEIMNQDDMTRGLNIVHIRDAINMDRITTQSFDIYETGSVKLEAFLHRVDEGDVIIAVVYDDAFYKLSQKAKDTFHHVFHSQQIHELNYRGQWAFIGRNGAPLGGHIEQLNRFVPAPRGVEWADQVEIHGCLQVNKDPFKYQELKAPKRVIGSKPCDVTTECSEDSVPMHIESGSYNQGRKTLPRVCIDGMQILGNHRIGTVDPASRGLNFVIYDPIRREVVEIARFDVYESAGDDLQATQFLKSSIPDGCLLIGTTFDEATRQLSFDTKGALKTLGSTQIFGVDYRENWVFVGQKGIEGYSPYEKIGQKETSGWGAKADIIECIPNKIQGVDVKLAADRKRQRFCDDYVGYPELCAEENLSKGLYPLPLDDSSLQQNPAYSTPIVIVPGTDLYALDRCLASLLAVPGIRTSNVLVVLEGSFSEPNDLVSLYGFRMEYMRSTKNYQHALLSAMERSLTAFPGKEFIIVIEDYVTVSPDFLHYFSQTLHLLEEDDTLLTVSAWNQNGFEETSGDPHLLYRTEDFPGFGWVLRRTLFNNEIHNKDNGCCGNPTWRGWFLDEALRNGRHVIVPDLSRVQRIDKDGFYEEKSFMDAYTAKRRSSSGFQSEPRDAYKLVAGKYDKELQRLADESTPVTQSELSSCIKEEEEEPQELLLRHEPDTGTVYSVFYHQKNMEDQDILRRLCQCFGLFVFEDTPIRGLHKGLLRFTRFGNQYLFIGTFSPYYLSHASIQKTYLPVIGGYQVQDTDDRLR